MTVDQIDELIRKYLSTGVTMVLVLVGPATAPSGETARPSVATASAHSTAAPLTADRPPGHHNTDGQADRTAAPYESTDPPRAPSKHKKTDSGARRTKPTAAPTADADPTADPTAKPTAKPTSDASADPTADPTDAHAAPTVDATADSSTRPTASPSAADDGRTAAATYRWGTPNRQDDFTGDLAGWGLYDGPGHAGKGTRSPNAATVANGVLTIRGDAKGTTEGMAWDHGTGQKYGRWEGRVRAPTADPTYNALLLLWPDAEDFPQGGEIDFMEMTDHTRQSTNVFLHHGKDNAQEHGLVKIDATQWHNWAVEWTPNGVTTYVDGKPWWHTADTAALPPRPMHLCIQLDWFPQKAGEAVTPSQMQVDWVRQYPLDTPAPTAAPTSNESVMQDVIHHTFGW